MKVYVAGPMRGIPHFNAPAFDAATDKLRALGHLVFNPAEHDRQTYGPGFLESAAAGDIEQAKRDHGFSLRDVLGADTAWIADQAELIAVLPGWEQSPGANAEVALAWAIGIPVARIEDIDEPGVAATIERGNIIRIAGQAVGAFTDVAPATPGTDIVAADGMVVRTLPERSTFPLIGLSGYATAGKDEAARGLLLAAYGWQRRAFADKLRDALYALNPLTGDGYRVRDHVDVAGWQTAKFASTEIRELLQRLGTDAGRNVLGENVWVDAALADLEQPTVFTDCRFPNEADAIRARGGIVVRIDRDGVGPLNDHPSETSLDSYRFDAVVHNHGSIDQLHAMIRETARRAFPGLLTLTSGTTGGFAR